MSRQPDAARLISRVRLQAPTVEVDDHGDPVDTWSDAGSYYAEVLDLSGRELVAAQAVHAAVRTTVTMWPRPWVTTDHRVLVGSRVLGINAVISTPDRRLMVLYCSSITGMSAAEVPTQPTGPSSSGLGRDGDRLGSDGDHLGG